MKRIICLFVSMFLIVSAVPVSADNASAEVEITKKAAEAISLIEAITGSDYFDEGIGENVTRADYIVLVGKLLKGSPSDTYKKVFLDVADNSEYAPYVYWALESGFVSASQMFRPEEYITLQEAVKICISAMGQTKFAKMSGGYPEGYMSIASELELFDNMDNVRAMTKSNVAILLYNMLVNELLSIESTTGTDIAYKYQGKNLLYEIHKIKITEGIITQTKLTSFDKNYAYSSGNNVIAVGGHSFYCETDINEYFGMNCLVYCREDKDYETVIGVCPVDNDIVEFKLNDVLDFNEDYLEVYSENGKIKRYRVKSSYAEVYNEKLTNPERTRILGLTGKGKLLDNDRDGVYDILFIRHYTYSEVRSVNVAERIIEDKNSIQNNIKLNEDDVFFSIKDSNGNVIKPGEIKNGDILAVLKSEDNSIVHIRVLANPVFSKIDAVNEDGTVMIGDKEYIISDYAKTFCDDRFAAGEEIEFYHNGDGEIAYAYFVGDKYTYGYLVNVYEDELDDSFIKVFATSNMFKNYKMADKLLLDGDTKTNDYVYDYLIRETEPQLIRYKLNKKGLVVSVDTAEECIIDDSVTLDKWEAVKDENNMLTRYDYGKSSYMFRSNLCFGTSFNAVGAFVFMVPVKDGSTEVVDIAKRDEFEMIDITKIQTGFAYSYFDVYDVDEYGAAGVLVGRNVKTSGSPYSFKEATALKSGAGMISRIVTAVNEYNELGFNVEICSNGVFKEYFLHEDVKCIMAPGTELEKGDIVRFRTDGVGIKEIILDFDYSTFDGNYAYNSASAQFNKGNTALTYQVGKLYNNNNTFCSYSNVKSGEEYDFSPVNLNNSQVSANNICCYDTYTGEILTITANDLRPSKIYGNEADYVLIKQDGLVTQSMFVYRNGGI